MQCYRDVLGYLDESRIDTKDIFYCFEVCFKHMMLYLHASNLYELDFRLLKGSFFLISMFKVNSGISDIKGYPDKFGVNFKTKGVCFEVCFA